MCQWIIFPAQNLQPAETEQLFHTFVMKSTMVEIS